MAKLWLAVAQARNDYRPLWAVSPAIQFELGLLEGILANVRSRGPLTG